jgi:Sigma-70, region 4
VTACYDRAVRVLTQAARSEHDFAGWLAAVLADVAGNLGSADELTIGRPGSWEADHVQQLVKGMVGHADEYLPAPSGGRKLTDAKARQIKDALLWDELTQKQIAARFGVSQSTVSDISTGRTWGWLQ